MAVNAQTDTVPSACVVVLSVIGAYRGIVEIADGENLLETPYGVTLLIKIGLFLPLLGLAAANLLLVRRRLAEANWASEPDAAIRPWYGRIRQTVGGEVLLVSAVLVATAVLTALAPARDAFGPGLVLRGRAEDLRIVLAVSPGQPGFNTFDVYLRDEASRPIIDAEKVALIFTMVEHNMGESEAVANHLGGGHYLVQGGYVSMSATWRIQLLVRRLGRDDARTTLILRPPGATAPPSLLTRSHPRAELLPPADVTPSTSLLT